MSLSAASALLNPARLLERMDALGQIGRVEGAAGGVRRLALTEADVQARRQVVVWMEEAGLEVRIDRVGNIFAWLEGRSATPCALTGSHLDGVAEGGRFDGVYGVLAGLEVLTSMREAGIVPNRPLAVASFTNEEGVWFPPENLGSRAFVGELDVEEALRSENPLGETLGERLAASGFDGPWPCGLAVAPVAAFVELHVEQGPLLAQEGLDVGVVDGVQGAFRAELAFRGESNHAGTTPMWLRKDAGMPAARTLVYARKLSREIDGLLATCGALDLSPGLASVVPGVAKLCVDLRHPVENRLTVASERLIAFAAAAAGAESTSMFVTEQARRAPVAFDPELAGRIEGLVREAGLSSRRLYSGASHDASSFASRCPTALLFAPSERGVSHSPDEYSTPERLIGGARALALTLAALAEG